MTENGSTGRTCWLLAAMAVWLMVAACGGAEERPQDCTDDEFYNDQAGRCVACPAVQPPTCGPGCGFEISTDDRGCEVAECRPQCDTCEPGNYFDDDTAACEPCPGVPDCSQFDCDGALRVDGSFEGACPPPSLYSCGECTDPEAGCQAGDQGQCVDL
jgi:hypothetical protein